MEDWFKKNIKGLHSCLTKISKLETKKYFYKVDAFPDMNFPQNEQMGLIAQDVIGIFPEIVRTVSVSSKKGSKGGEFKKKNDKYLVVDYVKLVPLIAGGIKEQQKQIDELNTMLTKQ